MSNTRHPRKTVLSAYRALGGRVMYFRCNLACGHQTLVMGVIKEGELMAPRKVGCPQCAAINEDFPAIWGKKAGT